VILEKKAGSKRCQIKLKHAPPIPERHREDIGGFSKGKNPPQTGIDRGGGQIKGGGKTRRDVMNDSAKMKGVASGNYERGISAKIPRSRGTLNTSISNVWPASPVNLMEIAWVGTKNVPGDCNSIGSNIKFKNCSHKNLQMLHNSVFTGKGTGEVESRWDGGCGEGGGGVTKEGGASGETWELDCLGWIIQTRGKGQHRGNKKEFQQFRH